MKHVAFGAFLLFMLAMAGLGKNRQLWFIYTGCGVAILLIVWAVSQQKFGGDHTNLWLTVFAGIGWMSLLQRWTPDGR